MSLCPVIMIMRLIRDVKDFRVIVIIAAINMVAVIRVIAVMRLFQCSYICTCVIFVWCHSQFGVVCFTALPFIAR